MGVPTRNAFEEVPPLVSQDDDHIATYPRLDRVILHPSREWFGSRPRRPNTVPADKPNQETLDASPAVLEGAQVGSLRHFESRPDGSTVPVDYQLVIEEGKIVNKPWKTGGE